SAVKQDFIMNLKSIHLVCAMQFWLNFFTLSHIGLFDVCFSISWHPTFPFAVALCEQEARQQCMLQSLSVSPSPCHGCLSVLPSVWSRPNYGDADC
ncbi:hypothetical protein XENOCAPTIV_009584, partial [Xenoophorus captivus]